MIAEFQKFCKFELDFRIIKTHTCKQSQSHLSHVQDEELFSQHVHSHRSNNGKHHSLLCDRDKLFDCHIFSKMLTKAKNLFNPIKYLKALLLKVSVLSYFILDQRTKKCAHYI